MVPDEFKNFYLGENKLFFSEYQFVIKLSFPRVFVRYKKAKGYYSDFNKFFNNIAEVQYLDGKRPSESEHEKIISDIWNYIAMETSMKQDDYIDGGKS